MPQIRFTFIGRKAKYFLLFMAGFLIMYYWAIENSVQKSVKSVTAKLVIECKRKYALDPESLKNPQVMASFKEKADKCRTIKVSSILAHGGLILAVALRVELSEEGHIPGGKQVRYFITRGYGTMFPFTLYNVYYDDWFFVPAWESNAWLYYLRL